MSNKRKLKNIYKKSIAFQNMKPVKVITRIRRCGKSSLFELINEHFKEFGISEKQIVQMNFESYAYKNEQ